MNRVILLFLCMLFISTSCEKESEDETGTTPVDTVDPIDTGEVVDSIGITDTTQIADTLTVDYSGALPSYCGSHPETTSDIPHHQIGVDIQPDVEELLFQRVFSLPGVENQNSVIANWRGLWLADSVAVVQPQALISGREFGHIHDDGSLHIFLEPSRAIEAIESCWGIAHPFALQGQAGWEGFVMLYTPQSIEELDITFQLIVDAYNYVTGQNLLASDY